ERSAVLSETVGIAGVSDVAQGAELLDASDDLAEMGAFVAAMSTEDLERGMDLASLYGELVVAGDVMAEMGLPVMAAFLADRGQWLREIAVDELRQYGASRALAELMEDTSQQVADLGIGEALAEAGIEMTAEGLADMAAAEAMRDAGATLALEGIATVAEGAADMGASEALHATAARLESTADESSEEESGD
nr:hypothetical protein [Anaerolineae bacterium]